MFPVVDFPSVVKEAMPYFEGVLTQPQRRHFQEALTGLLVSPNKTVSGINRCIVGHRDQSSLNRFFTRSPSSWDPSEVNRRRIQMALEKVKERGLLLLDDTLLHKYGKKMPGVDYFYDTILGAFVLAQQLVTTHFTGNIQFPAGWRRYEREEKAEDFRTKIELAKDLVTEAVNQGIPFDDLIIDSWYFADEVVHHAESHGKGWVAACKSNRSIKIAGRWTRVGTWAKHIPTECFHRIRVEDRTFLCFVKTVEMRGLGRVRVLVSYENRRKGDPKIIVTNHLEWEAKRILATYLRRSEIETFYRDAKQNLGLEECQLRSRGGTDIYTVLSFVADTLLTLRSSGRAIVEGAVPRPTTVGRRCFQALVELLRAFVLWVLRVSKETRDADEIVRRVLASRREMEALGG